MEARPDAGHRLDDAMHREGLVSEGPQRRAEADCRALLTVLRPTQLRGFRNGRRLWVVLACGQWRVQKYSIALQ